MKNLHIRGEAVVLLAGHMNLQTGLTAGNRFFCVVFNLREKQQQSFKAKTIEINRMKEGEEQKEEEEEEEEAETHVRPSPFGSETRETRQNVSISQ